MMTIIGGGMSGLFLGYFLKKQNIPYRILEKNAGVGGNIQSIETPIHAVLDLGPNSLILKRELEALIMDLGIQDQVVYAHKKAKKRYVLKNGKYQALPTNPIRFLLSNQFSWATKKRVLKDLRRKPNPNFEANTLSVHDFFRDIFGEEITNEVVNPFVSGIFAGDIHKLSVKLAFPMVLQSVQQGSIIKGMFRQRKKNPSKGIISFKKGLGTLVKALYESQKENIYTNITLQSIDWENKTISTSAQTFTTDVFVFTTPAHTLAPYVESLSPSFAQRLKEVVYPTVRVVHSVYAKKDVGHPLDGFGALHPTAAQTFTLGTLFSSSIFEGRCSSDNVLLTTFLGGRTFPEIITYTESETLEKTHQELAKYLNISQKPLYTHLHTWEKAIPQYEFGYEKLLQQVQTLEEQHIYCSGNWVSGISVENCLTFNLTLAQKLSKLTLKRT